MDATSGGRVAMDPHYNDPALVFIQDFLRHASVIREHMFEDSRERSTQKKKKILESVNGETSLKNLWKFGSVP